MKKLLPFVLIAFTLSAQSQSPILEKTYDVSGKAKRGFLAGVEYNKDKETFDMYYMVSSFFAGAGYSNSSVWGSGMNADIPCEVYSYDKELNEKGNSKAGIRPDSYEWANFKGYFTYETVQGWMDLGGLSFKKGKLTYRYDPNTGQYNTSRWEVIDKEKPKQGDGTKYSWMGGYGIYNVTADKSTLMVMGKKMEKSEATKKNYLHYYNHLMKYDVVHCDFNLNTTITDSLDFQYAQGFSYSGQLKDQRPQTNDELPRDWVLIFLAGALDASKFYYQAPTPNIYTYVRISPKGKILEKIQFESPINNWRIEGIYEENKSVYIYGSSVQDSKKGKAPMSHYQIGKISNGKFDFIKAYSFKDIQTKMQKPSNQKTMLEITGENEKTTGIILNNGDMFFCYQSFEMVGKGSTSKDHLVYRDIFMLQFDASGNLKKNYGIELTKIKAKDDYIDALENPAINYFYLSGDGKGLYWFIASPKDMTCSSSNVDNNIGGGISGKSCRALKAVDYTAINIETGELSEIKSFGNEKKDPFYLFGSATVKPVQAGNFVYFFSENEKGSEVRLTRVDISK